MKIFLSWSGQRSREIASALHEWLPDVIYGAEPWMSTSDINKGDRWALELALQLEQSRVGILCLTPDNTSSPWLNYEAGALANKLEKTFVCTYLCGIDPTDLSGPFAQFQATRANREDTEKLVQVINHALAEKARAKDRVTKTFDKFWPDLEKHLNCTVMSDSSELRSSDLEKVRQALQIVEGLADRLRVIQPPTQKEMPRDAVAKDPPTLGGLDPEDPAAVEDAVHYLREQGLSVSRVEVQDLLFKLRKGLLAKLDK